MSDWFTSKLKAAETILHKIDKQAAESLRKDERPRSDDVDDSTPAKLGGSVSLKDQLKKKAYDHDGYDYGAGARLSTDSNSNSRNVNNRDGNTEVASTSSSTSPSRKSEVNDGDWTELLGVSNETTRPSVTNRSNGTHSMKSSPRRPGSVSTNSLAPELKRNQKGNNNKVLRSSSKSKSMSGIKLNEKQRSVESHITRDSEGGMMATLENCGNVLELQASNQEDIRRRLMQRAVDEENVEDGWQLNLKQVDNFSESAINSGSIENVLAEEISDTLSKSKKKADANNNVRRGAGGRGDKSDRVKERTTSRDMKKLPSGSDVVSASETESGSSSDSDSEYERERREERRRKREKILAEKAVAKAAEAIRERENMVARLEGEKQSLEKIIEERAKQQAEEASELQNVMIETMEAAELEKQKHNNTRMEALAKLAKLETANAELAKSLATAQWNLEIEVKKVTELRHQIKLKEVAHEEMKRRISSSHHSGSATSMRLLASAKGVEVERELLEAECAVLSDKLVNLQEKARSLEANIEVTRKELEEPTEVEIELKRRLGQLTDHLIQKQAQVESLSSEKATLLFRIEAVSRLLEENKSATNLNEFSSVPLRDVESGMWDPFDSKPKHSLQDKIRSGREQIGCLVRQLDSVFLSGAVFLRRNPTAKIWAVVYLVCLHIWVLYILTSHSGPSSMSGAVISLENLSNSSNI